MELQEKKKLWVKNNLDWLNTKDLTDPVAKKSVLYRMQMDGVMQWSATIEDLKVEDLQPNE